MAETDPHEWPHSILLLGDQVYADEVSPHTLAYIRSHRDTTKPPHEGIANFEEYTQLYYESWRDPPIRWLLSTVPSAMIFDDHDVIDDWNTSLEWVEEMRATDWWDERVVGGFMTYVLYQHWGNLSPDALEEEEIYQRVRDAGDGGKLLRDYAYKCDREVEGARWSYCRDIGCTRVVMIDSRAGRVLTPGERSMVDDGEWDWITEHATGGFDHLLIGTSLPLFLAPGLHYLEAWNEAVCDGAWGGLAARLGEKLRQGADLEHWPAFRKSFNLMCGLLRGRRRRARAASPRARLLCFQVMFIMRTWPRSRFRRGSGRAIARSGRRRARRSAIPLSTNERRGVHGRLLPRGRRIGRVLARVAGVPAPPVRWRFQDGDPRFDNQVGTLELDEARRAGPPGACDPVRSRARSPDPRNCGRTRLA